MSQRGKRNESQQETAAYGEQTELVHIYALTGVPLGMVVAMKSIHVQEDRSLFIDRNIGNLLYTAWHVPVDRNGLAEL